MANETRLKLYKALGNAGFNIGSYEDFDRRMNNAADREKFHYAVSQAGYNIGDFETFDKRIKDSKYQLTANGKRVNVSEKEYKDFARRHPGKSPQTQQAKQIGSDVFGSPGNTRNKTGVPSGFGQMPTAGETWQDRMQSNEIASLENQSSGNPDNPHVQAAKQRAEDLRLERDAKRGAKMKNVYGGLEQQAAINDTFNAIKGDQEAATRIGLPESMQQIKDEMDYASLTDGEMLQDKENIVPFTVNTLGRDENGNPMVNDEGEVITGFTSEEPRVAASDYYVKSAKEEHDKNELRKQTAEKVDEALKALNAGGGHSILEDIGAEEVNYGKSVGTGPTDTEGHSLSGDSFAGLDAYMERAKTRAQYNDLLAAKHLVSEAQGLMSEINKQKNSSEFENFLRNIPRGAADQSVVKGVIDFDDNRRLIAAIQQFEKDKSKLTEEQKLLLDAAAINTMVQSEYLPQMSTWSKAGQTTGGSASLMLEIAAAPLSGLGKQFAKQMSKKIFQASARRAAEKGSQYAVSTGAKRAARLATAGAYTGATALRAPLLTGTIGAPRVAADALRRMQGDIQYGYDENGEFHFAGANNQQEAIKAFRDAFVAGSIENFTEMENSMLLGGFKLASQTMPFISKVTDGLRATKLGKIYSAAGRTELGRMVRSVKERTGLHDFLGENLEEIEGGVLNALFVGDNTIQDVFKTDNLVDIGLGVAPMQMFFSAISLGGYTGVARRAKRNIKVTDANGAQQFGQEEWDKIKMAIDGSKDVNELKNVLTNVISGGQYSNEAARAAYDYARAREGYKGAVLGEAAAKNLDMEEKLAKRPSNIDVAADGQTVVQKNQNGEVISEEKFEDEEEAKAHADILKMQRAEQDFQDDLATAIEASEQRRQAVENGTPDDFPLSEDMERYVRIKALNRIIPDSVEIGSPEYEAFVRNMDTPGTAENDILLEMMDSFDPLEDAYESVSIDNDSDRNEIDKAIKTDPVKRTERQQKLVSEFAAHLHMFNFPKGELHPEQSFADGQTQAELDGAGTMEADPEAMLQMKQSMDDAQQALDDAVAQNTDLAAYVNETINSNEPFAPEDVISGMIGRFSDEEIATVADYINAQSKLDGYLDYTNGKIQQYVERETSKRAFKGRLNGAPSGNMVMVTDGENQYFLVNGDVQVGENGEILSAGEANGIVVVDEEGNILPMGLDSSLRVEMGATLEEYAASLLQQQQENTTAQMGFEGEQPSPNPIPEQSSPTRSLSEEGNAATETPPLPPPEGEETAEEEVEEAPQETEQEETVSDEKISEIDAALAKIPTRKSEKDGEPDYIWEDAPAEDTIDALAAINDGNMDAVSETATMMRKEAESELKKAEKLKTSGKNPIEMAKSRAENRQKVEEAQKRLDYWKTVEEQVKGLIKQAEEAPLRQAEEEDASTRAAIIEEKSDNDAKWKALHQLYDGTIADDGEILDESRPMDINELVAMNMPRNIAWESYTVDGTHVKRGLQDELGSHHTRGIGKNVGTNAFNTFLAKKGTGISIDEAIHQIWESGENELANGEKRFSDQEIRNAVIDMFLSAERPSDITNYVVNNRSRLANEKLRQEEEYMREQEANAYADAEAQARGFADADEESDYNEFIAEEIKLQAEYEQRTEEGTAEQMPPVAESAEGGEQGEGGTAESAGTEREVPLSEPGETETEGDTESGNGDNAADGGVYLEGGESTEGVTPTPTLPEWSETNAEGEPSGTVANINPNYKPKPRKQLLEEKKAQLEETIERATETLNDNDPMERASHDWARGTIKVAQEELDKVNKELGEAATESQPTVKNPSGNKLVTDERYEELKKRMRDKLLGQMNIGVDPEILALGVEMAVYHIEKGARKFAEYAKAMIEDMGDVIRPYLKAFYNGARDLPEMEELSKEMDDYGTVQSFDVANFDKQTPDPIAQAQQIRDEEKVEKDAETAKESLNYDKQNGNTVNVNKTENNEPKKVVNLHREQKDNENDETRNQQARGEDSAVDTPVQSPSNRPAPHVEQGGLGQGLQEGGSQQATSGGVSPVSEGNVGSSGRPDRPVQRLNLNNNHEERGTESAPQSERSRIQANIEAIKLMQQLVDEGRDATEEEKKILRRFSGWGGLGMAFDVPAYSNVLRSLLSSEAYDQAQMSRNSAYFTPAKIIDKLWDIAKALGFKGGKVLEGSAGIGKIIGLMPTELSENSNIQAVEIDETTGNILKLLYPDAQVDIQGFEETKIPNGSVDLAITNVPFVTGLHVKDTTGDKDLSKKFKDIHDFCIAKNIRKLKEGGIGIFITSNGTLDNSNKLREWIIGVGAADVVGAFRLNNETFGGTGTTSDIIVVRKRVNGQKSSNAIDVSLPAAIRQVEYDTGETKKVKGKKVPIIKNLALDYNGYFVSHPENMGGEMAFNFEKGKTWQPTSRSCFPVPGMNQDQMLEDWVKRITSLDWSKELSPTDKTEDTSSNYEKYGEGVKEGSLIIDSKGNVCIAQYGEAVPLGVNANKVKGKTKQECVRDYQTIKNALNDVLDYQVKNEGDEGLKPLLDKLNRAYDNFVKKYGYLHKNVSIAFLRNDVDYASVMALETFKEKTDKQGNKTPVYGKADVFSRRVVEKEKEPQPQTMEDGVIASIYKFGGVNIPYIANQLGLSEEECKKQIIDRGLGFENPDTTKIEVSYVYLSGNVREKLQKAREVNTDGRYSKNISALEKIIPNDIPAHLIEFNLGSTWIDPKLYEEFFKLKTGKKGTFKAVDGTWIVSYDDNWSSKDSEGGVISDMCDKTILVSQLIEAAMQGKNIRVAKTVKYSDNTSETIVDKEATQACATRIDELKLEFKDWVRAKMQSEPEVAEKAEKDYNDKFNNFVPLTIPDEFAPEHFGGQVNEMNGKKFGLRPHQSKAVVKGVTQPVLLAHEVGTGKTFTLITTAMEMRRLGTAKKPMIVVQNATVGQFAESAKALYPNAKILMMDDKDHSDTARKQFYAKIKYNDWDLIIVPQSVLDFIPDNPDRQLAFVRERIKEKERILELLKEDRNNWAVVNKLEKEIEKLDNEACDLTKASAARKEKEKKRDEKKRAVAKQNAAVKAKEQLDRTVDDVDDFDDMEIDAILVDEAHGYKKLGFATVMQKVKGVDTGSSKKCASLLLKTRAVLEKSNGKNVVFATGTPVSNTAAEIWTFMRYLMPADVMEEYGILYFDDFARNFGSIQQMLEFSTSGKFKENNRFAGYVNMPELARIWSAVADTVLTREAGAVKEAIPELEGGKATDIYLPQTRALRAVMKFVRENLEEYENMSGKEKKENSHIPLTMYGIAKAAAVDARLVDTTAVDDPNSKTNEAVRQTLKSLSETKEYKGTVAIFADNYQNKKSGFNLYEDIRDKLIKQGVPAEQIAIIRSGLSDKKKLEIFDKVNSGEIRVVLGSTQTLGTGVNIQERLHTLIHMDAPNRPMDYTQRNGRILRQGNLHKDWGIPVRVLRFGVEDSLDVTAYQRLKTKGAIADSVMNGKQMMANSMNERVLEEEEDVFGDTVAQLSGSEYAMLKNQAEKEVRKLEAKKKQHEADQIFVHAQLPRLKGQNKEAEERIEKYKETLAKVEEASKDGTEIVIGEGKYSSLDALTEFFTNYNSKLRETEKRIRESLELQPREERVLEVTINGFKISFRTVVWREVKMEKGQLVKTAKRGCWYSSEELWGKQANGDPMYFECKGGYIKNGIEEILNDTMTGNDYRESIETAQNTIERNNAQIKTLEERQGKDFSEEDALEKARERLDEYTQKMKEELEAKEAKYKEMDADVEASGNVTLDDEDDDSGTRLRDVEEYTEEEQQKNDEISPEEVDDSGTRFRIVEDEDLINELESGEKVTVYRAMQLQDGKLYPPMAAKVNGQWQDPLPLDQWSQADEHPELVDKNGKFNLDKGNGKMVRGVVYAPYMHGSTTMLNDQFKEAQDRPELVVVEAEMPASELTSGYQAEKSPRKTGMLDWKAGTIQGQLTGTRQVMLSRWVKPIRIVPSSEVAANIKEMIDGQVEIMPTNVVTPEQREELEKLGVKFVKTDNKEIIQEGEHKGEQYSTAYGKKAKSRGTRLREGKAATQSQPAEKMKEYLTKLADKIGTKVVFHDDASTITNAKVKEALQRGKKVAGWYDPKDNSVHFYMPNIKDRYEAEKTIWHEVVGHKGMRALLGEEGYRTFMRRLWMDKSEDFEEMHQWVVENFMRYGGDLYETMDEWFAYNVVEPSVPKTLWDKVMQVLSDVLRKLGFMTTPNMKDMKYMLWLSRNAIREGDAWTELQRNATLAKLDLESRRRASAYGKDAARARDGFANTSTGDTEREMYRNGLMRKMFAWTEAHQDYMASAKLLMDAILKGRKVLDRFNFYMKENHADSKIKIMEDLYVRDYCKPMEDAISRCVAAIGGKLSEAYEVLEDYMAMKHGLERNREFFVRDWMEEKRKKTPTLDDLDEEAKSEYESAVRGIEQGFEDGQIETEEERDKELKKALEDSYSSMLDRIESGWAAAKQKPTNNLAEWLKGLDDYIRQHINDEYEAGKHDYSGLTSFNDNVNDNANLEDGYDYDDDAVVGYVMDMESKIGKENVEELWKQKGRMTQFALDIEHEAGLITDKNYEKVSQMFHWYMPLRKWDEDMAEDIWSYMNSKKNTYVGRTLMKAGGRKSRAAMPIGTMFAMGGNAISRAARNEVKKAFAGFVRMYERPAANNDDDPLVTELEAWVENLGTEENPDWVYSFPDIPENATADEVREAKNAWAQHMLELMQEGRAMRVRQGDTIPYRFESKKRSRPEHIVEVYEEGQPHFFIVNDNPRAAQAINGQLKPETKHKITAQINRFMSSVFTSYSPTFMARNAFRDAEFASSMLSVKEGWDYCQKFMKNYMKVTNFAGKRPLMFTLFRKFRDGTLDENNKMERYFKEFAENGGITGYVMENNAERWEKEILAGVKEIGENQVVGITKNIIKRFMEGVEHAGEAIENAARFATYVTSRESGRTVTKSVNDAKEVSVNFNRKGAGHKTESLLNEKGEKTANNVWAAKTAQYMRANTLFYNASLQGIMNTVGNAARKPWWFAAKFAIPPMVLGALVPVFNAWVHAMLDDDDDKVSEDPYADLPEYTRRMNMCLYIGHGKFLMIPLSIEHRAFFGLGDIMAGQTYDEKLKNVNKPLAVDAVSQLTAFSPVDYNSREMGIEGVTGWGVGIIVPAYISPLVNAYFNKSWTGSQIQRENAFGGSNLPEYQKAKDYTNKTLVGASRMWHELWGGNDAIRAGREQDSKVMEWIGEVSPAKMEYVVEQYFGEPGKLGTGVSDMFSMMFGEKEADLRKIPVVKAFATLPNDNTQFRRANTKYWKYRDEFKKVEQDDRQYRSRIEDDPVLKLEYENKFKKSRRYKQWRIYHPGKGGEGFKYKKTIEDLQKRINAEDDPVQKRGLQHERNILVQQLVDTLDNIE